MRAWGDLFTARQKAALVELSRLVRQHQSSSSAVLLALSVSRFADIANSLCQWENTKHQVRHLFTRQSIPMLWDFAEASFLGGQAGDHATTLRTMARVVDRFSESVGWAQVQSADAVTHPLPDQATNVWFTDPPYYDAVPYAHLADFFFVWLRRTIPDDPLLSGRFESSSSSTPKAREIVVDRPHRLSTSRKNAESYEQGMAQAFAEGRRVLREDGIGSVVFAHKTTAGWEALLSGVIRGGWTVTGSWPIATEMSTRPNARQTASLATSIHLVCRPRAEDAPVGDWAVVLRKLPQRVGEWMQRLQGEGIRGADLVFACIGPALEIFQPLLEGRDGGRARGWPARVPGEGLGGRRPHRAGERTRCSGSKCPQRAGRRTGGGCAADGALPLDTPGDHERGHYCRRRARRQRPDRRGRRRQVQQGNQPLTGFRCRAPLRAAARHRPPEVGRSHHRNGAWR